MTSSKLLSPWLPFELVEEILHRIPIESLARFKSVSKQWYALFIDKIFIYKHLDLFKERLVLVNHILIQLFNLETKALSSCQLPTPDELHNYKIISTINHCDGLFLFKCSTERGIQGNTKLAVLNPVFSRIKWIQLSSPSQYHDVYGFGYDNVSRDKYKILRIGFGTIEGKPSSYVEIYEFKSKLWRSVNATLECSPPWRYVSMNGNMYWIARKKMAGTKIECFDFSMETFKPLCCVPNGIDCYTYGVLSRFGGDRLSLLHREEHVKKTEVWVTSKLTDDGVVSWSNYFNVTHDPQILSSVFLATFILKANKIMLWCDDKHVKEEANQAMYNTDVYEMGYEGDIKKLVEMTERRSRGDCKSSVVYVPSLVPVPV